MFGGQTISGKTILGDDSDDDPALEVPAMSLMRYLIDLTLSNRFQQPVLRGRLKRLSTSYVAFNSSKVSSTTGHHYF